MLQLTSPSQFPSGQAQKTNLKRTTELLLTWIWSAPHLQRKEDYYNTNDQLSYETDDLTMMPECVFESEYIGFDPAIDYDMEILIEVSIKQESKDQEVV